MDEMEYFIQRTDARLERIENKVDLILNKFWMLVGMATTASAIISIIIGVLLK